MDKKGVLERRWHQIAGLNRILLGICAMAALAAGLDLYVGLSREWNRSAEAVPPRLEELGRPLEEIPSPKWTTGLFPSLGVEGLHVPSKGPAPQLAPSEVQWRLKGIQMGNSPKAYLEDSQTGTGIWVRAGEKLDHRTVKEIRERSVLLEEEGGSVYELRM